MGASDWAGEMVPALQEEFNVTRERAVRITNRVRMLASRPEFKDLRERGVFARGFQSVFVDNLVQSLHEASGDTIEERWNNLTRDFGLYDAVGEDVLLTSEVEAIEDGIEEDDGATGEQNSLSDFATNHRHAQHFLETAQSDPSNLDFDAVIDILETPTDTPAAHGTATQALVIAGNKGQEIDARFVDPLVTLLDRPSLDANAWLLRGLREIAKNEPGAVIDVRERIFEEIHLDETETTKAALECATEIANHDPSAVLNLAPKIAELLVSDNATIRDNASFIVARIARDHPDEIKPVTPKLAEKIAASDETYQTNVLAALGHLTSVHNPLDRAALEPIAQATDSHSAQVRGNAIGLMADLARRYPDAVSQHQQVLVHRLEDSDGTVRANTVSAILHIALEKPDAPDDALPGLIELTDDPSPMVRRNVARTLGYLEATVALEQLRNLADNDSDEEVREIATWAVSRVAE